MNTYEVKKDFADINIDADTEDIRFVPAKDGKCTVVCVEEKNEPHNVRVDGSTLKIDRTEQKSGFHFGIVTEKETITVYLPDRKYGELELETETGDVEIPKDFTFESMEVELNTGDISCLVPEADKLEIGTDTGAITVSGLNAKEVSLKVSTGRIEGSNVTCGGDMTIRASTGTVALEDVTCRNLSSEASSGGLSMKNVIAKDTITIVRTTGDVRFDGCDAETIYVTTDTGDVSGTLLSDKVFHTESDTGKVNVPKTITGGRCVITTDTGDISLEIRE